MRTAICTPSYGNLNWEHLECVNAATVLDPTITVRRAHGHSDIAMARTLLAREVLADDTVDVLFWVDDDILFQAVDLMRVASLVRACRGAAMIGGVYSKKRPRGGVVGVTLEQSEPVRFFEGGSLVPAEALGGGFVAVHRATYDAIKRTLEPVRTGFGVAVPYYYPLLEQGSWFSEDVSFCRRARAAGVRIEIDSRVRLAHVGAYAYGLEDAGHVVPRVAQLDMKTQVTP